MVLGGHLLALGILLHRYSAKQATAEREPIRVFFLSLPRKIDAPPPEVAKHVPHAQMARNTRPAPATAPAVNDTAITLTDAARIDWSQEARAVAQAHAPRQSSRICDKNELPDPRRPTCTRAPHAFEWNPETPRVGVEGIFPYVRVGDSCIVGLGFFGCHEKMPANSRLFEEMKNPDRPESSVPEAPR